jgi:hypothetical protein
MMKVEGGPHRRGLKGGVGKKGERKEQHRSFVRKYIYKMKKLSQEERCQHQLMIAKCSQERKRKISTIEPGTR